MTTTNGAFTALEAENAMLRQRISELEARLASHDGNALSTTDINEFRSFRTLIETAPQAISIARLDGVITYANPAFCALTGYDRLVGLPVSALLFDEDLPLLEAGMRNVLQEGVWRDTGRLRRRDGSAVPVRSGDRYVRGPYRRTRA